MSAYVNIVPSSDPLVAELPTWVVCVSIFQYFPMLQTKSSLLFLAKSSKCILMKQMHWTTLLLLIQSTMASTSEKVSFDLSYQKMKTDGDFNSILVVEWYGRDSRLKRVQCKRHHFSFFFNKKRLKSYLMWQLQCG